MANKVLIEVHGSLVNSENAPNGPVRSGVVLQVVRCGQVRSGVAGAVRLSQTAYVSANIHFLFYLTNVIFDA